MFGLGKKIEQDPKKAIGLVKREVTEIITPGAVLDQSLLEGNANVFLASLYFTDFKYI